MTQSNEYNIVVSTPKLLIKSAARFLCPPLPELFWGPYCRFDMACKLLNLACSSTKPLVADQQTDPFAAAAAAAASWFVVLCPASAASCPCYACFCSLLAAAAAAALVIYCCCAERERFILAQLTL